MNIKKIASALTIVLLLSVIVNDSKYHFDPGLIHLKRQHKSAQKNWNLFYDQRYVFADSAFRYEADFDSIAKLIQPESVVLSDISSSYYAATYLPVYVKNIHRHQGRDGLNGISYLLNSRKACYLQDRKNIVAVAKFIYEHNTIMRKKNLPEMRYFIVNRDTQNLNLRQDCLWTARLRIINYISGIAKLKWQGEYLNLYEIKQ